VNTSADHPAFPHICANQASAFERGRHIGEKSKERILWSLETYDKTFSLCDISWADAIALSQPYLEACKNLPSHFIEELNGIAAGAGVDFDSLWALNSRTEILPADFLSRAHALLEKNDSSTSSVFPNECTSLSVTANDRPVWLAQNWDWCGRQRQALCVVEQRSSPELSSITVTEAGMLAKIGLNNHGFGITLNILRSNNDGASSGVPVHILLRTLLDCTSVTEAIDHIRTLNYASSSNVIVADKSGASASIEISPSGVKLVGEHDTTICHTNHFIDNELSKKDVGRIGNQSTINRLQRAKENVDNDMSFDDIKTLLCNTDDGLESICRYPDTRLPDIAQIETVTAIIMNLSEQTLSVSAAQPNISDFAQYHVKTTEASNANH